MELFPYCWIESGSPLLPWWLSGKESACSTGDVFWSLGRKDPLEKEMATHSSILAWRIPMDRGAWWATIHGITRVRHDLETTPPPPLKANLVFLSLYFLVLMDIYLGQIFTGRKQFHKLCSIMLPNNCHRKISKIHYPLQAHFFYF